MVQGPCTCDIATWVPQLLGPTWQWHDWAAFSALFKQRIKFLALSGQTTVRRQNMQTKDSVENRNRPRHSVSNLLLVMPVFFFSQIRNAQYIDRPFSERRAPMSAHPVQEWQKTVLPLSIRSARRPASGMPAWHHADDDVLLGTRGRLGADHGVGTRPAADPTPLKKKKMASPHFLV
jgi:hypothetical protein